MHCSAFAISLYLALKAELRVNARIAATGCFNTVLTGLLFLDAWTNVYGIKQAVRLIYAGGTQGDLAAWLALGTSPAMALITCVACRWPRETKISPDVDPRLFCRPSYLHEERWTWLIL